MTTMLKGVAVTVLLLLVTLPLASSKPAGTKACSSNEFWSTPNGCCLPIGGPSTPSHTPPKGSTCPPTTHYWGERQGCCVPRYPPPEHSPPPQCPKGWVWNKTVRKCEAIPTPPKPSPPKPSHYHSGRHNDNALLKRRSLQLNSRPAPLCPNGIDACPISGAKAGEYECLDTAVELKSCGGCTSLARGQDCTTITGAWNVGCDMGRCVVYTCAGGFKRSHDGKSCTTLK